MTKRNMNYQPHPEEFRGIFDQFMSHSPDIMLIISHMQKILWANRSANELFSEGGSEVLGQDIVFLSNQFGMECPFSRELPYPRKTRVGEDKDRTIEWRMNSMLDDSGFANYLLVGRDVSESEQLKSDLFELNNVVRKAPGCIFWKDKDSIFRGSNENFARQVGFNDSADIVGKSDYDMQWKEEEILQYIQADKEVIRTGKPKLNIEGTHQQIDGTEATFLTHKVPIFDTSGLVSGVLGIAINITDRKQIEESLRVEKEKAEAANRAKKEFLHNMRHDIRTPFSGIISIAQILRSQEQDENKVSLLEDIEMSADGILEYLNEILEFTQIESGEIPVLFKPFNLKELVEICINVVSPSIKSKQLDLIFEYDTALYEMLIGDSFRIKRILINLLCNAVKFTQEGFVKILVSLYKKRGRDVLVRFIVEDSGIGIPVDKYNYIFESFSRLNPAYEGAYKGTGLGLPAVKKLLDELDADIEVKSKSNEGSSFICTVPMKCRRVDDF